MSSLPAATAAIPVAAPTGIVRELRAMLALALPLVLTQLTQILVHTTEVLMLGRMGAAALAAATLAAALFHTGMMFAIGVASASAPLIAQAKGARQPRQIRRVVRQGLWMTLAITVPLMAAMWFVRPLLSAMGQDEALLAMTEQYMRAALWGLPFSVGFIVLRSFVAAFGHARAILAAALVAALVNIPLSWVLIFGGLGVPAMGTQGAGIGVAVTFALMFGLLLAYCLTVSPFRRYNLLGRFWRPDWATFREIVRVGFPIGGAVVMETGLFAASTLFMGLIGTAQLAAHQIALQLASIAFMVPLGLSHAATIRIGLAVGAGDMAARTPRGLGGLRARHRLHGRHGDPVCEHARHPCRPVPRPGHARGGHRLRLRRRIPAHRRPVPAGRRPAGDRHRQPARAQGHHRADVAGGVRLLGGRIPDLLGAGLPHRARRHRHLDRPRLRAWPPWRWSWSCGSSG